MSFRQYNTKTVSVDLEDLTEDNRYVPKDPENLLNRIIWLSFNNNDRSRQTEKFQNTTNLSDYLPITFGKENFHIFDIKVPLRLSPVAYEFLNPMNTSLRQINAGIKLSIFKWEVDPIPMINGNRLFLFKFQFETGIKNGDLVKQIFANRVREELEFKLLEEKRFEEKLLKDRRKMNKLELEISFLRYLQNVLSISFYWPN